MAAGDTTARDRVAAALAGGPWALVSERLDLEPLVAAHAAELFPLLADPALHTFTGSRPPASVETLAGHYRWLEGRRSPDGSELWLNWVVRERAGGAATGYVQATVAAEHADLAWVIGVPWQRRGHAVEAATALVAWLDGLAVARLCANILPGHVASERVAARLGMKLTGDRIAGERVWERRPGQPPGSDRV